MIKKLSIGLAAFSLLFAGSAFAVEASSVKQSDSEEVSPMCPCKKGKGEKKGDDSKSDA